MTSSPLVDAALGYFSPLNLVTILSYLIVFMILLVPMVVCAKIFVKRNWFSSRNDGSSTNVSTNDVGSITAIKTLSCRSQRSIQNSGGPDHLAPLLMGRMSLFGDGIPGTWFFSQGYLWLNRLNFYLTRRIFADQIAQWINIMPFGETPFFHARTCWLDDCVEEFLRRHAKIQPMLSFLAQDTILVVIAFWWKAVYMRSRWTRPPHKAANAGYWRKQESTPSTHNSCLVAFLRRIGSNNWSPAALTRLFQHYLSGKVSHTIFQGPLLKTLWPR